jgi:protein phosphatase
MDAFGLTDTGKVRPTNEDQFLIASLSKSLLVHQSSLSQEDHTRVFGGSEGMLLLVADGMGGHAAGKQASTIAVEAMQHHVLNAMPWFFRLHDCREDDFIDELKASMESCQQSIERAAAANPARRGMGTTLTMAYVLWPRLYVVHAGDSRCYLFRGGRLERITTDHTVAQQLVDRGAIPAAEAQQSRWSHMLWNCLGGGTHDLTPEVYKATLEVGDTLLFCTDGLTTCVREESMASVLKENLSAEQACRRLVDAAHQVGARDNVTVVVARFRDVEQVEVHAHHEVEQATPTEKLEKAPVAAAV